VQNNWANLAAGSPYHIDGIQEKDRAKLLAGAKNFTV